MRPAHLALLASALLAGSALAASCSATKLCPQDTPCCDEYGSCGTGTACLGGCNPLWSYGPEYCAPQPKCVTNNYTFSDTSRMVDYSIYNNDASAVDFTLDSGDVSVTDEGFLQLELTKSNGGPRISLTRPIYYGTVTAKMRTTKYQGVISSFITFSGVRDEIDFEWVGTSGSNSVQSNWYWEGLVPDDDRGIQHNYTADSSESAVEVALDWQEDTLQWLINGQIVRTVNKNDTVDSNGLTNYPDTPSRIQFGVWASGAKGTSKSTKEWGGGSTSWKSEAYKANGYYNATIEWVNVECADATASKAYTAYVFGQNSSSTSGPSVSYTTNSTKIYTEDATGANLYTGQSDATNTTNGTIAGATADASGVGRVAPGWGAVAAAAGLGLAGLVAVC